MADTAAFRRPRRRPGENRERLLAAGILVFGAQGYQGAATAAIAAMAEVPQPHVYASFRTKQELFLACAQRVLDELVELVDRPAGASEAHYGAFLLQCFAAAGEPKLQPQLDSLLARCRLELGEARLFALIEDRLRALLDPPSDLA